MTNWQRFADDVWINVDHVEVIRVDEEEEGGWQLSATFASGRTYPIGSHDDRELLAECTDAVLRGEIGERLRELAEPPHEPPVSTLVEPAEQAPKKKWWRRRSATTVTPGVV